MLGFEHKPTRHGSLGSTTVLCCPVGGIRPCSMSPRLCRSHVGETGCLGLTDGGTGGPAQETAG